MAERVVEFEPDHKGIAAMLVGPEMHRMVRHFTEHGARFAQSISPDIEPYGRGYIASFEVVSGLVTEVAGERRATAELWNTSDYAAAVEWEHDHHVLARTVDEIEAVTF